MYDQEIVDNLLERYLTAHRSEVIKSGIEDIFNGFSCSYPHTPYSMPVLLDIISQIRTFKAFAATE